MAKITVELLRNLLVKLWISEISGEKAVELLNEKASEPEWIETVNNLINTDLFVYKFTYKDKYAIMKTYYVSVKRKDSELAIATFEKQFPSISWREFELTTLPNKPIL